MTLHLTSQFLFKLYRTKIFYKMLVCASVDLRSLHNKCEQVKYIILMSLNVSLPSPVQGCSTQALSDDVTGKKQSGA